MGHLNRRDFFTFGRRFRLFQELPEAPQAAPLPEAALRRLAERAAAPPTSGLAPYTGPWNRAAVIHLLRRTTFGFSRQDVDYFLTLTPAQAVYELLHAPFTPPAPPVNDYNNADFTDPDIAPGDTWIDAGFNVEAEGLRIESLRGWWYRHMLGGGRDIREKMTLFWHNHVPVQFYEIFFGPACYRYMKLLRENALGNFKGMMKKITLDPAMLIYLNGYLNSASAPDENYAREIQELFVIGKDLPTYFTEDDVKAAARLLTGWRTNGYNTFFSPLEHDTSDKQFSAFYNNTLIQGQGGLNGGEAELDDFLDMLFAHPEAARFFCRKLYRFFVYHDIDAQTEQNVIVPLAQILRDNNYELMPVLDTLFKSEHFFDVLNRGAVIKSPVDFTTGLLNGFGVGLSGANLYDTFVKSVTVNYAMFEMLQIPGDPPNVAGWQAYYQQPALDKLWINTSTLPKRGQIGVGMVFVGIYGSDSVSAIDPLAWAATLTNPADPNSLIDESLELLLGLPVAATVKFYLKLILLSNLPNDYYWTAAWENWQNNPNDPMLAGAVRSRLQGYLYWVLQMEEYQLM